MGALAVSRSASGEKIKTSLSCVRTLAPPHSFPSSNPETKMASSSVPTQLVVLRSKTRNPTNPERPFVCYTYGKLHNDYVLFATDREILKSSLKKRDTSSEWAAYATNRRLTFQTRRGWEIATVKKVPYMFDIHGHIMPVFDIESNELAKCYTSFYQIKNPPAPPAPVPLARAAAPPPAARVTFQVPKKSCLRKRSGSEDAVYHGEGAALS
jgi:hypothetical protein